MKDALGQKIKVGDVIAYGKRKGDYAELAIFEVLDIAIRGPSWQGPVEKLQVRRLVKNDRAGTYGDHKPKFRPDDKPVWIVHGHCTIRTNLTPDSLKKLMS